MGSEEKEPIGRNVEGEGRDRDRERERLRENRCLRERRSLRRQERKGRGGTSLGQEGQLFQEMREKGERLNIRTRIHFQVAEEEFEGILT